MKIKIVVCLTYVYSSASEYKNKVGDIVF